MYLDLSINSKNIIRNNGRNVVPQIEKIEEIYAENEARSAIVMMRMYSLRPIEA